MWEIWKEKQRRRRGREKIWGNGKKGNERGGCFYGEEWFLSRVLYADVQTETGRKKTSKIKTCNGKKNIALCSNLALWLVTAVASAYFTFMPCEAAKNCGKMPLCASTFGLIGTIYFCLRYGWVETEVGVWRQIASIYSSKLKVLSWTVRADFHFPLH